MKEKTKELADSVGAVYPVLFMGRHDGVLFTETELETFANLVAAHKAEVALAEAYRCGHEAAADELRRLHHNSLVLTNALWKACGDDEKVVNATIESQGEMK